MQSSSNPAAGLQDLEGWKFLHFPGVKIHVYFQLKFISWWQLFQNSFTITYKDYWLHIYWEFNTIRPRKGKWRTGYCKSSSLVLMTFCWKRLLFSTLVWSGRQSGIPEHLFMIIVWSSHMENTWNPNPFGIIFDISLKSLPPLGSGLVAKVGSKRVEALLLIDRLTWKTLETQLFWVQYDQIKILIFPILYEACFSRRKVSWYPVWYPIGVNSVKLKWETGLLFRVWLGLIWRKEVNGRLLSGGPWNNQTFNRPHIWSELGCRLGSPHISMLLPAQLVPDNFLRIFPSPHHMPVFRTCLNFKSYFHQAVEKECKSAFQEAMIGWTSFELLHPLSGETLIAALWPAGDGD